MSNSDSRKITTDKHYNRELRIIQLNEQRISYQDIARQLNTNVQTVKSVISKNKASQLSAREFTKNRVSVLQNLQKMLLESISEREVIKLPVFKRVSCASTLYDMELKELAKSNVAGNTNILINIVTQLTNEALRPKEFTKRTQINRVRAYDVTQKEPTAEGRGGGGTPHRGIEKFIGNTHIPTQN